MRGAFELTEMLYYRSGIYKKATERIVDYFLTKPIFSSTDDEERKRFEKIMSGDFGVMQRLREIDLDKMSYGNGIASINFPFKRTLRCMVCSTEKAIINDAGSFNEFYFSAADYTFHARCSFCKTIRQHTVRDYPVRDASRIRLVRWDPKRIHIEYNEITGDKRFWLDIDPGIISRVRSSDPFTLATLPASFLTAIKNNQKYRFNANRVFHTFEPSLAGLNLRGWGVPPVLSAFRNFFRLQVLYRYDEVMKMDFIVPLRIISPAITKMASGNSVMELNLKNFSDRAMEAVERHRIDGADWNFFPFAVNYQAIGGEGQQLDQSQRDTIQAEEDRLLNVRGIPPELYRASLTLVNAPVGLRLFEAGNIGLTEDNNRLINWMSAQISRFMECGSHEASVERVTITDNLDDKVWRLQAAQSGIISKETGFSPLGIDAAEEERRVLDEQMRSQREQQKAQQELSMEQMSIGTDDSSSEGRDQGGGMTIDDLDAQADEEARAILDPSLPESAGRQRLAALRNTNGTLHALVLKKLDQYRSRAGVAGRAAGLQSMGIGKAASVDPVLEKMGLRADILLHELDMHICKRASAEQITGLMMHLTQAFPVDGGKQHTVREQKNGRLVLSVFTKQGRVVALVDPEDLDESPERVVSEIKREME